ncbi:MAG: cyclic nucleotide-binding domain-containing protein [Nodosilinea sp.]
MVNRVVGRRLGVARWSWPQGLPTWKFGRLTRLLLLAGTVLGYSVMAIAIANSLFVSDVGADRLPTAYIAIGLCSFLAYGLISQVVDRFSPPRLFCYALAGAIGLALVLRWFLPSNTAVIYYLLLISTFFQWDFHNNILYPNLLTTYFTAVEYRQYVPLIGIAQAAGALIGGGLTTGLSFVLPTRDLLLVLPLFFGLAIWQLIALENTQRPLEQPVASQDERANTGIWESLKTFPDLVRQYPLVLYLALSSFLLVIIYDCCEYLQFNLYGRYFSDQALTSFLGEMRIVVSVLQVLFLYGLTRPLLGRFGVARINPVYPASTARVLAGVAVKCNVPAAIALQINSDALYKSLNTPIHQLNYNAIPQAFLGRVRAVSDGLIYSFGLVCAGGLLLFCQAYLSLAQVAWVAAGLALLLVVVRLPMGRFYAQGLESMIRSNTINLDDFDGGQSQLPPQSVEVIRELLQPDSADDSPDSNRYTQVQALQLAANLEHPGEILSDLEPLIPTAGPALWQAMTQLFSRSLDAAATQTLETWLTHPDRAVQKLALEILIIQNADFADDQIQTWLTSANSDLRVLAALAYLTKNQPIISDGWIDQAAQLEVEDSSELTSLAQQVWQAPWDTAIARLIIRVVRQRGYQPWIGLLQRILAQSEGDLRAEALAAIASLATYGDRDLAAIAPPLLADPNPDVRLAALDLLGVTRCPELVGCLEQGLNDLDPRVRQRTATVLASYGRSGLEVAKQNLQSPLPTTVEAAIAAIGQVRTRAASDMLFEYLTPKFQTFAQTRQWQQQLPAQHFRWRPLAIAIDDYHQRFVDHVLYILSCLGHARTVNTVKQVLASREPQDLAKAVEVLASLRHRRFVQPLLPLLEQQVSPKSPDLAPQPTPQWLYDKGYKLLLAALNMSDRWIRIGAMVALTTVPEALAEDPDHLVRTVAQELFPTVNSESPSTGSFMNHLLLLKDVALFRNLSLDELFLIEQALKPVQYLAENAIFQEGSWSTDLYIVAAGQLRLIKQIDGEPQEIQQLTRGDFFGEVALFDDAPRWYGAIAQTDCVLLKLEKQRFLSLIAQRSHIILEICGFLSRRLRETDHYRSHRSVASVAEPSVQ